MRFLRFMQLKERAQKPKPSDSVAMTKLQPAQGKSSRILVVLSSNLDLGTANVFGWVPVPRQSPHTTVAARTAASTVPAHTTLQRLD